MHLLDHLPNILSQKKKKSRLAQELSSILLSFINLESVIP